MRALDALKDRVNLLEPEVEALTVPVEALPPGGTLEEDVLALVEDVDLHREARGLQRVAEQQTGQQGDR